MKTLILATAAIGALFAAGSAFAAGPIPLMPIPDGSANTNAVVEQIGDSNNANVNQLFATAATALVVQGVEATASTNGVAVVKQDVGSNGEQAVVVQFLNGNNSNVYQNGTNERAATLQYGNSNAAAVTQTGTGNGSPNYWGLGFTNGVNVTPTAASLITSAPALAADPGYVYLNLKSPDYEGVGILQVGDRNSATSIQGGLDNTAVTIQAGNDNLGNITQGAGATDSLALITQTGSNNIAGVSQLSANDTAVVWQNGTYNQAYVNQNTTAAFATVGQSGFNNIAYVTQ